MTDPLLDDVKALLDRDFGDDRILKQIRRACENNEVISNYERNYVKKLAEEHLGRRPEIIQTKPRIEEKPIVPDVVIPETPSFQKTQTLQRKSTKRSSNSKNSKIILGAGGLALVLIIAITVSFTTIPDTTTQVNTPGNSMSSSLSIQTDLSSYDKNDLISISGTSDTSGIVNLSIENPNSELVWAEQVSIKNNGQYSTLAISGGTGWENSGTYTIKVDNGDMIKSHSFSFTS